MEKYINVNYLILMLLTWMVSGWIIMVKKDSESTYDYVPLHDTVLYSLFSSIPVIAVVVSLVINVFRVGFLSTLCYIGGIIVTQLININIIYYIYRAIFGRDRLGTLIPLVAIIPLIIFMFVAQYK